jgi:hypothetical protein
MESPTGQKAVNGYDEFWLASPFRGGILFTIGLLESPTGQRAVNGYPPPGGHRLPQTLEDTP